MLYHLRVTCKSTPTDDEVLLGLSRDDLVGRILLPIHNGKSILVNGRRILPEDIQRIRISRSTRPLEELRRSEEVKKQTSNVTVIGGPSIDWLVAASAADCTDELLASVETHSLSMKHSERANTGRSRDPRSVFVVHGRNKTLRDSMFGFLRALGLSPIEWETARSATKEPNPYIGDVVDTGFELAHAFVVILSGDDLASLHPSLAATDDSDDETEPLPQPRPNVLIEAGMALGMHRDRTILVQIGDLRGASDIAGRYIIRFDGSPSSRHQLLNRLREVGCTIHENLGTDWLKVGEFDALPRIAQSSSLHKSQQLTSHQEDLLLFMLFNGGGCEDCKIGPQPRHIEVADIALYDPNDRKVAVRYCLALDKLIEDACCERISYDVRSSVKLLSKGRDLAQDCFDRRGEPPDASGWPRSAGGPSLI